MIDQTYAWFERHGMPAVKEITAAATARSSTSVVQRLLCRSE